MSLPIGFTNNLLTTPVLEIFIEPSIGITVKKLMQLDENLKDMRKPLELSIREVMRPSIRKNFDVGGRPKWQPLAEATLERRLRKGGQGGRGKILVVTTTLRTAATARGAWTIGRQTAIIDGGAILSKAPYAGVHQAGGGEAVKEGKNERGKKIFVAVQAIPARPFLLIQEEDKVKIERLFLAWLQERITMDWVH